MILGVFLAPFYDIAIVMRACLVIVIVFLASCAREEDPLAAIAPPVAPMQQTVLTTHDHDRVDEYYWIRDETREDKQVLSLLDSENAYTRAVLAHTTALQEALVNELSSRLPSTDKSVPIRRDNFLYFQEFLKGGQYPVYKRQNLDTARETVLLDVNALSIGSTYYAIGNFSVSPDHSFLAFAEDQMSRGVFRIRIKHIDDGSFLPDEITGVSSSLAWGDDNKTLFYVAKHPETLLPHKVYRRELGQGVDVLVNEEMDTAFYTSVYPSRSGEYIIISNSSADASEILLLDAKHPTNPPRMFLEREANHEYRIRHHDDSFYVLTNWDADNFRLMRVTEEKIGTKRHWEEVVRHRNDVLLEDFEVFNDYLVLAERHRGLTQIRVSDIRSGEESFIRFSDPAYSARIHTNPDPDANVLRYSYSSLTTPFSIVEYDMSQNQSRLLKTSEVVGNFDVSDYQSERIFFTARDGIEVPVSLVYRQDQFDPAANPGYLTAYGAYGYSSPADFQPKRLSLLDRGFVIAIIHVRGGEEMGRHWYESGKLLHKKNSFTDFIDGTLALAEQGYVDPDAIFAAGTSAGGLLMGVVANEAPELYRGIIAHVPFVDLLTTMLDESIPLTPGEYSEWGNPLTKEHYDYMLSYSPYDQVRRQEYPNMLVTTGLHDSRVQYFEPVKWVSRLRRRKVDNNLLLLDVDMDTGHGGASDRYNRYRRDAMEYAFMLHLIGKG